MFLPSVSRTTGGRGARQTVPLVPRRETKPSTIVSRKLRLAAQQLIQSYSRRWTSFFRVCPSVCPRLSLEAGLKTLADGDTGTYVSNGKKILHLVPFPDTNLAIIILQSNSLDFRRGKRSLNQNTLEGNLISPLQHATFAVKKPFGGGKRKSLTPHTFVRLFLSLSRALSVFLNVFHCFFLLLA